MDPFTIFSLVAGAVALIGSGVSAGVQAKREEEDRNYNKNLNQILMDREDNAWQRAVEDRSKAGLSIAGLNSGSGSGGTVSQLQSGNAFGNLSNVLQNVSSNSFGLANTAYERKMQKEIHEDELELKKQQLKNDKLNSRVQRLYTLGQLRVLGKQETRDQAIYSHNMSIAEGKVNNPLVSVYGSSPSELKELVTSLYNMYQDKKDTLADKLTSGLNDFTNKVNNGLERVNDSIDYVKNRSERTKDKVATTLGLGDGKSPGVFMSNTTLKGIINEFILERSGLLNDKSYFIGIEVKASDPNDRKAVFKTGSGKRIEINVNATEAKKLQEYVKNN